MLRFTGCGCASPIVVRVARRGIFDALMLKLGLWPWVCRGCERRIYRTNRSAGWMTPKSFSGSPKVDL